MRRNSLGAIFTHTSFRDFPLPYRASLSCPEGCVLLPTAYHRRAVVGATIVLQRLRHKVMGDVILLDTFSKIFSPVCEFQLPSPAAGRVTAEQRAITYHGGGLCSTEPFITM